MSMKTSYQPPAKIPWLAWFSIKQFSLCLRKCQMRTALTTYNRFFYQSVLPMKAYLSPNPSLITTSRSSAETTLSATRRQDSFRIAYWIRFKINPGSSLRKIGWNSQATKLTTEKIALHYLDSETGTCPTFFMVSLVLVLVTSLVHGAGTSSTIGAW